MFIFGGSTTPYDDQISLVESCHLIRLGTMPVKFYTGACNSFKTSTGDEQTLLCFGTSGRSNCHRFIIFIKIYILRKYFLILILSFNGNSVSTYITANNAHAYTSLGQFRNIPVALGDPSNKKMEVLQTGKWSELADFPFVEESIRYYSFVNFDNALYLFGKIFILNYKLKINYT